LEDEVSCTLKYKWTLWPIYVNVLYVYSGHCQPALHVIT